ncbi:uncharacterized protein LOC128991445 isoform X2 [Macrosteles quadrilineatus]|nr:uncharacterized protein LOC128991437 [Macrosteles quadrilineatus]XP_054270284.1 uncharacterized protein LOC128991437 [Macrosteles quadrilineatus]XP_054270299.1 uncharacterized protein LOC128991445 isoform X2 [Macrosteles quadrilineatus]XP_054270300.1 uncharacterized protein LOC128991445 isoform X2 [Macrosteles quadrilineatus]XP_054270301.1 uncharacterized protein LOC128991445 isoform X2 [Macrosteles quadrilineatus]
MASKEDFENFWSKSDRRRKHATNNIKISELHMWGKANELPKKSPTLNALINSNAVKHGNVLPEECSVDTFYKILEELSIRYKIVQVPIDPKFKGHNAHTKILMIEINTVPPFTFDGSGLNEKQALHSAARKGLKFLIAISSDTVIL